MTEAELLFTEVLNCSRLDLHLDKNRVLHPDEISRISCALERRVRGEPLQYILGKTEFMGLNFKVTPDVLIPRPETEILVETVIGYVSSASYKNILDIGTGSGCIAISLANKLPGVKITALDISHQALEIARQNAVLNNVNINFIQSDLFENCQLSYELIISNPPYVACEDINKLQREVQYEPKNALDGGGDGLNFYRRIIAQAPAYLKEEGLLILEIGFGPKCKIKNICEESGNFKIIDIVKDYNGIDRCLIARKR